ncbi:VOC family protein [Roseomonas hellenica]|uniref:VOC family protein n=1 Tax=Plastoroseomonas hellenica TaxID=2687306 RepID=A0ABS5EZG1_9PROT|nr:VOC family protein [Plastoroseomonas hellenica]MBR0665674.1 VOC family protein [Plastoroseomonas hellenica]
MQQISLITLGISDVARSQRFYAEGFGWQPIFTNGEITFYQMNGLVLATWLAPLLAADAGLPGPLAPGGLALSHNVTAREAVPPLIERLLAAGGRLLKAPVEPPHGGLAGHVADPDGHVWEIAWNPDWAIDAEGRVTFGAPSLGS